MNEESQHPSIEQELEARIVALVLGEASDFETDELNRLIALRPELAAFKSQMQIVHGLLQDVGAGELEAPAGDWKLPADKRNAVLAVIRGETVDQPVSESKQRVGDVNPLTDQVDTAEIRGLTSPARLIADDGLRPAIGQHKSTRSVRWNLTKLVAVVCVAGFLGIVALPLFITPQMTRGNRLRQVGLAVQNYSAAPSTVAANDQRSRMSSAILFADGRVAADGADLYARSGSADIDHQKNSESALSSIRNMLSFSSNVPSPAYLSDDIQYSLGGPAFKLPESTIAQDNGIALENTEPAAATIVDGSSSTRATDEGSAFIARNDGAWGYRVLGDVDRGGDGAAEDQPESPDLIASEVGNLALAVPGPMVDGPGPGVIADLPFPMAAPGGAGVNGPGSGLVRMRSDVPDGAKVLLGGLAAQSATEAAPGADETSVLQSQIVLENEKQPASGMSLDLAAGDVTSPKSEPELLRAEQPLRELADTSRQFSKDQLASPDDREKPRDHHLGYHFILDGFDALVVPHADEKANMPPGGLSAGSGPGPGELADRNGGYGNSGSGGFGGGSLGGLGVNQPSSQSGIEMQADASGNGIAAFEKSAPNLFFYQGATGEPRADDDFSETLSLESLGQASRENSDGEKPADRQPAGEEFGDKVSGGAKPGSGGVPRFGVDFDFNIQDSSETPTPSVASAVESRQLQPPSATTRGGQIQDGRKSDLGRTSTPSASTSASPTTDRPPVTFSINGRSDAAKSFESLPPKQQAQQVESRRASGELTDEYSKRTSRHALPSPSDNSDSWKKLAAKAVAPPAGLNETTAAEEAFSTFSLHVSDVSFKLALAAFARGEWPEAAKIRIEEFVNAFDYGDPLPGKGEPVACRVEQSIHPFLQQRNLLRVSMRTAAAGRASSTPLRLTFLLDNSGSMERTDRQQTVRRAFALLTEQLTPIDQVTLISFARQPRLLADKISGAESGQLVTLIDELPSEGGTNIEAALQLAFEKAREQQTPGAQNRIILLTDGAVNLGNANPESLSQMVTTMRGAGIAFDAAGISADGLNDEVLEALTRKGDGRYYLLDSMEAADDGFARQIAGALHPSAKNVKVQVEFNPKRVGHYKLLGFEKHILKKEDFRNDKVDAAEMAAAEAGVAMYQFEAKPDGEGDVGSVSVRFQDLSTGKMIENRWPIPYEADAPRPDQAAPSLRIATSAALLAAKLRSEPLGETVDLQTLSHLISGLPEQERNETRVQQLKQMIEQARQISGK